MMGREIGLCFLRGSGDRGYSDNSSYSSYSDDSDNSVNSRYSV